MRRDSLTTQVSLDAEVAARVEADSYLASFVGHVDWETTPEAMPTYSSNISISDGASLLDAIGLLDSLKNRLIEFYDSGDVLIASNVNKMKFDSRFILTEEDDGDTLHLALSGDVIYNLDNPAQTLSGASAPGQWQTFTGNRFAYALRVAFTTVGSIGATFSVVSNVSIRGVPGRL